MVAGEEHGFFSRGERCAAWLYRPEGEGPHPGVVMAHGFGATRDARLWAFAERFADAGIAALVFDYRHFGESEGEPRQIVDIGAQLDDWRAAIVYARSLAGVDPDRLALWGTSFAGGHVVRLGAEDARVAAVVSQAPYTTGISALREAGPAATLRLSRAGLGDVLGALRGREPNLIPIVAAPGETAAMTSPDSLPGYTAMYEGRGFRNEFAARGGLSVIAYNPALWAPRLGCPLLVCVCDRDAVTPAPPAVRMAARAPDGELVRYPIGHFDIYVGEWFERAVSDQAEFLSRHLPGEAAPAVQPASALAG